MYKVLPWLVLAVIGIWSCGCSSIMTTVPLVNDQESCKVCIEDGTYTVDFDAPQLNGIACCVASSPEKTSIELDIKYDAAKRIYSIIKRNNNERYIATACERDICCYASLTAQRPNLDELNLSEDERLFIIKGYINLKLEVTEQGYDVFALSSNESKCNPILGYDNRRLKEVVFDKKLFPFKHVAVLRHCGASEKNIFDNERQSR